MQGRALAGSAALLLAACGGTQDNSAASAGNGSVNTAAADKGASSAQKQVRELDEAGRNGVLIRAIRDAGQECQHVDRSELIQTSNNLPVYMATCDGSTVCAVAIRDDGQAVVQPAMREEAK
jgi:hypothetical protein